MNLALTFWNPQTFTEGPLYHSESTLYSYFKGEKTEIIHTIHSLTYQEVCGDLPLPGRMANFAAGVICLHMFSIVTLKIT